MQNLKLCNIIKRHGFMNNKKHFLKGQYTISIILKCV